MEIVKKNAKLINTQNNNKKSKLDSFSIHEMISQQNIWYQQDYDGGFAMEKKGMSYTRASG